MRIGLRLLIGYVLVALLACYLVFTVFLTEVRPTVRQVTEGMLLDTATLLAKIVSKELITIEQLKKPTFFDAIDSANTQPKNRDADNFINKKIAYRIYVTDQNGIVLFDSAKRAEGKDYSRWNDVYLTLRGQYGARMSRDNPDDPTSTVMYVAAPIKIDGNIVGVLTVSKPNQTMSAIVNKGEKRILFGGIILIVVALFIGLFFIWWINRSISKLVHYAHKVSSHEAAVLPKLDAPELRVLANALEDMRLKLEGKDYIEQYIHTLAHELKSPLASIRAATEIIQDNQVSNQLNEDKIKTQQRFLINIDQQTERMSVLIERMLQLARLESRVGVNFQTVNMNAIIDDVVNNNMASAALLGIELIVIKNEIIKVQGDKFLLTQAINNLLSNALDFTAKGGEVEIEGYVQDNNYQVTVKDNGTGIPDFALGRLYDRFYSLPRPNKGKSSGLGLPFVKEVAMLHSGRIFIQNRTDKVGTIAQLTIRIK